MECTILLHILLIIVYVASLVIGQSPPQLVELSYTFDDKTPSHPILTKFDLRAVRRGRNKFGVWVELNDFSSSEHSGTHMDAPVHFWENGKTIDQIPFENLYRVPGVKMDMTSKIRGNITYELKPSDLEEWITLHGELPDGVVVLFETGWGKKAFDRQAYSGMDHFGKLNFPSLGEKAAKWLANYANRTSHSKGVLGVGIDVISLDVGQSVRFPAHVALLSNGIYGIENLKDLHKLPPRDFTLTMSPVKIRGGSGAPARIVAEIGGTPYGNGVTGLFSTFWIVLISSLAIILNASYDRSSSFDGFNRGNFY